MARLAKSELLERVTNALETGGWNLLFLSTDHPFELIVFRDSESFRTRIYIWNVTHGGGTARAANEYRIQITSGVSRFNTSGVDRTLVLGWWEEVGVFAGFDVAHHAGLLGSSPSLQIQEETLRQAAINRVATYRKSNDEIALAFVPSFLGEYISQSSALHEIAESRTDLAVLNSVFADPSDADRAIEKDATGKRRTVLAQVAKQLRDSSFKDRVLSAYAMTCSMCGVQLRLIDAAHIVPAARANNDKTSNGLALCGIHHRAFDRALLTVKPDYRVALNPIELVQLKSGALDAGLRRFRALLRPQILLPPDNRDRPDPKLIEEANLLRGWTRYELVA